MQGAATTVYAATAPELDSHSGAYLKDCKLANPSSQAQDPELAKMTWEKTEELIQNILMQNMLSNCSMDSCSSKTYSFEKIAEWQEAGTLFIRLFFGECDINVCMIRGSFKILSLHLSWEAACKIVIKYSLLAWTQIILFNDNILLLIETWYCSNVCLSRFRLHILNSNAMYNDVLTTIIWNVIYCRQHTKYIQQYRCMA